MYTSVDTSSILKPAAEIVLMTNAEVGWVVIGFISALLMITESCADPARELDKKELTVIVDPDMEQTGVPERDDGFVELVTEQEGFEPVFWMEGGSWILKEPAFVGIWLVIVNEIVSAVADETDVTDEEIEPDVSRLGLGVIVRVPSAIL